MAERSEPVEEQSVRDTSAGYLVEAEITTAEDLPRGYKRTEVGVIPKDWSTETIFAVADYSKSRFDDGDWVEAEFLTTSGVRLLQTGNIGVGVFKEKESKKYISTQSFQQLRCKDVFPGDVLICRLADPAGRACIAPDLGSKRMITSVDVTIFRPSPELADPNFLLGVFCTPRWFSEVADRCGGSTRTRISRSQLAKIPVPLPSIQEQRTIATALSDADALIESLGRLIAKKRAIKQAAMQQLLTGQTRLPGFTGEWEFTTFSNVVRHHSGNSALIKGKLSPSPGSGLYPGFSASGQDIWCSGYEYEGKAVVVSAVGSRCGKAFVASGKWNAIANTHVVWPVTSKVDWRFLSLFLNREDFWLKSGSGQPFVMFKQTFSRPLFLPPLKEQTAIATVLSDMDTEIEALERRRDKARQIKQGMMQQLLTGRVRLVEPESSMEASV